MIIKFFIFLVVILVLIFIVKKTMKALNEADIKQKMEDNDNVLEQYETIKDVDFKEIASKKEAVEKFKKTN